MRLFSSTHPLATAVLNITAGLLIAYAFAGSELTAWSAERPLQLLALLVVGLVLAYVAAAGASHLPLPSPRFSALGRVATNASFGVLLGLVGAVSGLVVANVSLWGLVIWFSVGASVMSIYCKVCPRGAIPNG